VAVQKLLNNGKLELWALGSTSIEASISNHLLHSSSTSVWGKETRRTTFRALPFQVWAKFESHHLCNNDMR
jgi:hypothetical protein